MRVVISVSVNAGGHRSCDDEGIRRSARVEVGGTCHGREIEEGYSRLLDTCRISPVECFRPVHSGF